MEKNGAKRRLTCGNSIEYSQKEIATNTELRRPMQLNAWCQTSPEDFVIKSNLSIIEELENRINNLEQLFESLNVIPTEDIKHVEPPHETKYKIPSSNGFEYIERVDVDEEAKNDHNSSSDLNNLKICIPKDNGQQNQEEDSVEEDQQIVYQSQTESPQHNAQNKPIYKNNLFEALLSVALQSSLLSPVQEQSQCIPVPLSPIKQENMPVPQSLIKQEVKKEKNKKIYRRSTTNNSPQQKERMSSDISVSIGPHKTSIPGYVYETMDWNSPTAATRKLLVTIFGRETLATHTMTGKPSPAFRGRDMPIKHQLDARIVTDIIQTVSQKCGVHEKEVRNAITTKCADENKMAKQREMKRRALADCNKENVKNSK